jgi:mannosyltransferase
MKLILDNIVFSLQKAGGISVVWKENLKRIIRDNELEFNCLEYGDDNFFRKIIDIPIEKLILQEPRLSLQVERYLKPKIDVNENTIFHSSYYRYIQHPKVHNITTVHDFTYEYYRKGLSRLVHKKQKYAAISNSEKIICVSEYTKLDLLKFCPKIEEDKIRVIHNGVGDEYKVLSDKVDFIPFENGEYLLYVGDRKSEYKNFNMAVETSAKVELPLVIVGGELEELEEKFLKEKLKSKYFSLSKISNKDLNILYNNAFCFLYPSYYEGFGIPLLEAQKAGCPIISSNCSSIPEVAGKGAVLLDNISSDKMADVINSMKTDDKNRKLLIKLGLINSERFSWEKCYDQTKSIYKEFI